jgi:hypothetical protein
VGGSQAGVVEAHHAVQGLVLGGQLLDAPGEALQRGEDGGMDRVTGRPQPGQGVSAVRSFEISRCLKRYAAREVFNLVRPVSRTPAL